MHGAVYYSGVVPAPCKSLYSAPPGVTSLLAQRTNEERAVPLLHKIGMPDARSYFLKGGVVRPNRYRLPCTSEVYTANRKGAHISKGNLNRHRYPYEAERGKLNV
jgi:hypothetical protein